MIKLYLGKEYFRLDISESYTTNTCGKWIVVPKVEKWLNEHCKGKWSIEQTVPFDWSMYDDWMNDCINNELSKQFSLPNSHMIAVDKTFQTCKPFIAFDAVEDAVLCRLTF